MIGAHRAVLLALSLALAGCAAPRDIEGPPPRIATLPAGDVVDVPTEPVSQTPPTHENEPPQPARATPDRVPTPEPAAPSTPGTPRLLANFQGFGGAEGVGGLASIGAGPETVLAATMLEVALFRKDGTLVERMHFRDFLRPVLNPVYNHQDPQVSYDRVEQRFLILAAAAPPGGCGGLDCENPWIVAVSKTATPRSLSPAEWHFWKFDGTLTEGRPSRLWGDFNHAGLGRDLLVINGQMVVHGESPYAVYDKLWVFNKTDFLEGRPVSGPAREFFNITDPRSGEVLLNRFLPASRVDDADGVFLVHFGILDCDLIIGKIEGEPSTASLRVVNVHVPGECRRQVPTSQLGTEQDRPIFVPPHITASPVYVNGSLWVAQIVAHELESGWVNALRVVRLNVSGWPGVPSVEEDIRLAENGTSFANAAIAVSPRGDLAIVVNRLHSTIYPSAYYTGRLAGDEPGTLRPPVPLKMGEAYFDYVGSPRSQIRFGAYSGAALDGEDRAWLAVEYAASHCRWGVQIAQVEFVENGHADEPSPPTTLPDTTPCTRS